MEPNVFFLEILKFQFISARRESGTKLKSVTNSNYFKLAELQTKASLERASPRI